MNDAGKIVRSIESSPLVVLVYECWPMLKIERKRIACWGIFNNLIRLFFSFFSLSLLLSHQSNGFFCALDSKNPWEKNLIQLPLCECCMNPNASRIIPISWNMFAYVWKGREKATTTSSNSSHYVVGFISNLLENSRFVCIWIAPHRIRQHLCLCMLSLFSWHESD